MTSPPVVHLALKLYASLADFLPLEARKSNRLPLELPLGITVGQVIAQHNLPLKMCHLVLVNGVFVPPQERAGWTLTDDDELAIWPPVAGG